MECQYEFHAKLAKEQMTREIRRLQHMAVDLEEEKASLLETNNWIEQIITALIENGHDEEIINRLKRGESHKAIASWLQQPGVGALQSLSPIAEGKFSQSPTNMGEGMGQRLMDEWGKSIGGRHRDTGGGKEKRMDVRSMLSD